MYSCFAKVFSTFMHNFGSNYRIFREIRGTMLRDSVFKTGITVGQDGTTGSPAHEIFISSTPHFKNGKIQLPCLMEKTVNTPPDSLTTD
jgi:hypothetical protein